MTPPPPPLGVGVLGLHEGRTLLAGLNTPIPATVGSAGAETFRSAHARAVAGCDMSPDKLAAAEHDAPGLFYTADYDAMLTHPDVDIVAIYTPDPMHGEHIERAFHAGKHVICTKPLVNSVDDAKRILTAARETGMKLLVGQSTRFFEPFRRQRAAFERGEVGTVELADAHYNHRMDWYYDKSPWAATDSDWVYLGMSHPLDLLRWYCGTIDTVHAVGTRSALGRKYNVASNDLYTVNVVGKDGTLGRALGHYGLHELPTARNAIELMLYGSAGSSLAQYHDMRYLHTGPDGAEVTEDYLYEKRGYYFNNEVHGMHYGEFSNYADHFAASLIQGTPHAPGLVEGLETFCLMEAVRRSAETGAVVRVDDIVDLIGLTDAERASVG